MPVSLWDLNLNFCLYAWVAALRILSIFLHVFVFVFIPAYICWGMTFAFWDEISACWEEISASWGREDLYAYEEIVLYVLREVLCILRRKTSMLLSRLISAIEENDLCVLGGGSWRFGSEVLLDGMVSISKIELRDLGHEIHTNNLNLADLYSISNRCFQILGCVVW